MLCYGSPSQLIQQPSQIKEPSGYRQRLWRRNPRSITYQMYSVLMFWLSTAVYQMTSKLSGIKQLFSVTFTNSVVRNLDRALRGNLSLFYTVQGPGWKDESDSWAGVEHHLRACFLTCLEIMPTLVLAGPSS